MRNIKLLSGALVVLSAFLCGTAHAEDQDQAQAPDMVRGKPGIIATGAVLSAFGVGHIVIAGAAFASAASCQSGWCFKDMDNAIGGISAAIGGVLLLTGIPLIVYGANAKHPRAQVSFSPSGFMLSGTF